MSDNRWLPLSPEKLDEIKKVFANIYPQKEYHDLAEKIGNYWIQLLRDSWEKKDLSLKKKDFLYNESEPLSRIEQKTVVIAYADSIKKKDEKTLVTLDRFLKVWFPAIRGLHILPACRIEETRFNDGYFSQIERDQIHPAFGSNEIFSDITCRYFSMNDLVLGHVDIENPDFKKYLQGDDVAGKKFYVFTIDEHKKMKDLGCFDKIFRPRPYPLFTIFRRMPSNKKYRKLSFNGRIHYMVEIIKKKAGINLTPSVVGILFLFDKIKNDQMLLDNDYGLIIDFFSFLEAKSVDKTKIFTESQIQEVGHVPYIFVREIDTIVDLLLFCGYLSKDAKNVAKIFMQNDEEIFGEQVRVLTTFSHVQVDVNTATFEGLSALANDLVWYITKGLNMLRLDAVNYAFKKWGTTCFGLPQLEGLLRIIYLSMECISPLIVPNLEVNDSLTTILKQMSTKNGAPPLMHDFFLASLLPAVFNLQNPNIIGRIYKKISQFNIPHNSIRFSLSESHDGKSVRGSLDLLTFEERMNLSKVVTANGGYIKYKSISARKISKKDLKHFCIENNLNYFDVKNKIFYTDNEAGSSDLLILRKEVDSFNDIKSMLGISEKRLIEVLEYFFIQIIEGREPYELCISTRNSLPAIKDESLEVERFLSFETLAFAVMGRNIKTIYFNDLLALPNDYKSVKSTGEPRNIKRTKLIYEDIIEKLKNNNSFEFKVSKKINNLIALVDADPALNFRGNEAEFVELSGNKPVAVIKNRYKNNETITVVNLSEKVIKIKLILGTLVYDNITDRKLLEKNGCAKIELSPYNRLWLTEKKIKIDPVLLR